MEALLILFVIILIGTIIRYSIKPSNVVVNINLPEIKNIPEIKPMEESNVQASSNGSEKFFEKVMRGEDIGYWDGPVPSKAQEEKNKQEIFKHLEMFPNGILATRNPEYMEEYLSRIDLDLPEGVSPSKEDEKEPD